MTTKIQDLISTYLKAREEFLAQGKEAIGALFKQFFLDNPGVKSIRWEQYSPWFNDGDECVFSVRSPVFTNAETWDDISWGEYDGEDGDTVWIWGDDTYKIVGAQPSAEEVKAMTELNNLIQSSALEDVFHDLFGNHARVTVTAAGIDVDEANHD